MDEVFAVTLFFIFSNAADFSEGFDCGRFGRSKQVEDFIGQDDVGRDGLLVGKFLAKGAKGFE